jgi:RNA polymerase sigma-70 factor (ECF subfamily)
MSSNSTTKDAFLEAYEQYNEAIFRYCFFKVSDKEKAKDVTQDTFIKTWEYISKGNEVDNIKALLYRIANNLIIDGFRKKKSVSLDDLQDQGFDPGFDKTDEQLNKMDGAIALKLVETLPETYKDIILMRFVEELTIPEIAAILKEKENNVSVKLHRGIEKLRHLYNHHEKN